jgi:hypothetical protein
MSKGSRGVRSRRSHRVLFRKGGRNPCRGCLNCRALSGRLCSRTQWPTRRTANSVERVKNSTQETKATACPRGRQNRRQNRAVSAVPLSYGSWAPERAPTHPLTHTPRSEPLPPKAAIFRAERTKQPHRGNAHAEAPPPPAAHAGQFRANHHRIRRQKPENPPKALSTPVQF